MAAVLVTGASTGIGEACALHLAARGHQVFAGVRRSEDGDRLVAHAGSDRIEPVMLDVTVGSQIADVAARLDRQLGSVGLAGLVNNAGVAVGGPLEFLALDEWRDQLDVNVIGQVAVTQALLPHLRRSVGRIVFIGSISGRVSTPMMAPYGASKHAIEAIGESLREELRPFGMKVAVVEPGAIRTPIWGKGRVTADRLEDTLDPEAERLYGSEIRRIRDLIDHQEHVGIPPDRVATAVEHALFHHRPKHRYLVGSDAKGGAVLDRVLPDRLLALVLRRLAP